MTDVPNARLVLPHRATPARIEAEPRPAGARASRALGWLALFWALAPLVFFIPPHLPWVLAAVAAGIFFAWREWRGEYLVRSFTGSCPECGNVLSVEPGSKIGLPHSMTCYQCHHHPVLEAGAPPMTPNP